VRDFARRTYHLVCLLEPAMQVTKRNLKKLGACSDGTEYALANLKNLDGPEAIKKLIKNDKLDWANWGITRLLDKTGSVKYAIYAAKQVIKIYEDKYPNDKRPREAIKAADKYIKSPTKENANAAANASYAAYASYTAAYSANAAAYSANAAAYAAAKAAANASYAAANAANAANAAYAAAKAAANASYAAMKTKIIKYGVRLLNKQALK
jgi:hypothetical protein